MNTKKIATYGLLVALAFILSYIERLFPIPIPFPGAKIGLANLVVITALYTMGTREALSLSLLRIVLTGFTYGNSVAFILSLAGGVLSYILMVIFKKSKAFSLLGVSIVGGISHNVGQIVAAIFVLGTVNVVGYMPVLMVLGIASGAVIGVLGAMIVKRLKKFL